MLREEQIPELVEALKGADLVDITWAGWGMSAVIPMWTRPACSTCRSKTKNRRGRSTMQRRR